MISEAERDMRPQTCVQDSVKVDPSVLSLTHTSTHKLMSFRYPLVRGSYCSLLLCYYVILLLAHTTAKNNCMLIYQLVS